MRSNRKKSKHFYYRFFSTALYARTFFDQETAVTPERLAVFWTSGDPDVAHDLSAIRQGNIWRVKQ